MKTFPMTPDGLTHIWLAFDRANGHPETGGYGYCWWFRTRKAARDHVKAQNANPRHANLTTPLKYAVVKVELV